MAKSSPPESRHPTVTSRRPAPKCSHHVVANSHVAKMFWPCSASLAHSSRSDSRRSTSSKRRAKDRVPTAAGADVRIELRGFRVEAVVLECGDADVLRPPYLEEEAVLRIEMHRRRRGRGRDEQVARPEPHSAFPGGDERLHLIQAVVDDLRVLGNLLDVAQGDPEAV